MYIYFFLYVKALRTVSLGIGRHLIRSIEINSFDASRSFDPMENRQDLDHIEETQRKN